MVISWCNCGAISMERMDFMLLVDSIFPHGKDVQSLRPIRSQTPVLSEDEGLYPLSYGCVVGRLYLFRGQKSRNAAGADIIR